MIKKILFAAIAILTSIAASAQIGLGVRDTRYVNINYRYRECWTAKFEQSVYSEKMGYQYFRIYAGYERALGMFTVKAEPYFGMTYNNSYTNEGIAIGGSVAPLKWLAVETAIVPHHDSGMGYTTCYNAGVEFRCTRQIAVTGALTNRPEYRKAERRVRCGLKFTVDNLWVHPELSIPTEGYAKNVRMLVSMGYHF